MPKAKTKSSIKGRARRTANGKVIATQTKKRHNMRKLSSRARVNQRGTCVLCKDAAKILKKYIPYS